MKKIVAAVLLFVLPLAFSINAVAADRGTRDEAVAMVKRAVNEIKKKGKDAAFEEFDDVSNKQFHSKDLYIFVNSMDGINLAHGINKRVIGVNILNQKDPDGRMFTRERLALAKSRGHGWHDFKYFDPISHRVRQKHAYIEVVDNVIVGCGVYDND